MLFNSFEYAIFLPLAFILYWLIGSEKIRLQNILILISSYIFYGFWDWRFLFLIFLSSIIDYYAGLQIYKSSISSRRKFYLWFSIIWNLGILFTFKYFNFFTQNFLELFNLENREKWVLNSINIVLPVGLSFYTFQTLSYTIDVYRNKVKPTSKLLEFLCFVSFFPQLVAGPIERASYLLPQFFNKRKFNYQQSKEGLRQILWGLFKKIVVADNLAIAVNTFFENPSHYQSWELYYALILFYFQIYGDFSGYADIALGTSKLFGFDLHVNFKLPHFSKGIPEFWSKWNITVSQWFRDYVHIPFLQNRKKTIFNRRLALIITFGLIGLWHGAKWTFVIFGLIHAIYMIFYQTYRKKNKGKLIKKVNFKQRFTDGLAILLSFNLVVLSIVFFRAPDTPTAILILKRIFLFIPDTNFESIIGLNVGFLLLMLTLEIISYTKEYPLLNMERYIPRLGRWLVYYIFIYFIIQHGGPQESFIYFQF